MSRRFLKPLLFQMQLVPLRVGKITNGMLRNLAEISEGHDPTDRMRTMTAGGYHLLAQSSACLRLVSAVLKASLLPLKRPR
jgi:hypothetical protein